MHLRPTLSGLFNKSLSLVTNGNLPRPKLNKTNILRRNLLSIFDHTIAVIYISIELEQKRAQSNRSVTVTFSSKVLTNLLETDDLKCKTGSLRVLCSITVHPSIRRSVTLMGGIELLIKILSDPNPELQLLSTETVANLAKFRKARKIVRKTGGIPKLVDLLDVDPSRVSCVRLDHFVNGS